MNTGYRSRLDAILDVALSLPDHERQPFVDERCAGDLRLRSDVDLLLRLAFATAPALQPGIVPDQLLRSALANAQTLVGIETHLFGAWRIVREIGCGGMGTVYLVERADGQYEQQGALKLVRASVSSDAARRFRRERRILASLNHPNIARLLDGGQTEDGRPYFVMEFVEGRSIARFCDEERLSIDRRLDLFMRVCSAIHYAHGQLIVHRDIKPSNIIVTADGEVKLLDFGIARLLSASESDAEEPLTRPLMRMLTPEYASPEQVRGEPVAITSDVYQLGLLLYELLTGCCAQPVRDTTPAALERAVCETEPIRPSARAASTAAQTLHAGVTPTMLARRLSGDLDAIVLCGLRKEPSRRYATAGDFCEDVRRYRTGLPVRARGDSLGYRSRKFVGRHRIALGWTAVLVAGLAAAVPAWTAQRWRAAQEAARAQQMESVIGDLFALANPRVRPQPRMAISYVDDAAHLVLTELRGQPRGQARLLTHLGRLYNSLGHYGPSINLLEQALTLRRRDYGPRSLEVAETLGWLGQSQHYAGRYDEAEATLAEALAIRRAQLGLAHPNTIGIAIERGDLLHTRGRLAQAEEALREVTATLRGEGLRLRVEDQGHDALPRALRDLAGVLRDRGLMEEAQSLYREAIAIFRHLHGEPHQQIATTQVYLSRLLIMRGHFAEAEALLDDCLPTLRRIYEGDHAMVGAALRELGNLRTEQGRLEEAEQALSEAQRIQREWLGDDHPMVARARVHEAELELRRGDAADAAVLAGRALSALQRLGLADHPAAIDAGRTLGEACLALGDRDGAVSHLTDALTRSERQFVAGDSRIRSIAAALRRARLESTGSTAPVAGVDRKFRLRR